jgi:signal transduction histidine kinase
MPLSSRWIRFGWCATGIVGIAVVILMGVRERGQASADAWIAHTLEVMGALQETKSDLRGASNELRGYVLTGRTAWIDSYHRDLNHAAETVARTLSLLADNPSQHDRAAVLSDQLSQYRAWGENVLGAYALRGERSAAAAVSTGKGEALQNRVDRLVNAMLADERQLLAGRQQLSARLRKVALWLELVLGALVTAQIFASAYLVRSRYKASQREQETLRVAQSYAEAIVATIRHPLIVLDSCLRVVSANRAFYQLSQATPALTERLPLTEIGGGAWNIPSLVAHLHLVLDEHERLESLKLHHTFAVFGERHLLLNARKVYQPGVATGLVLLAIEDETEQARSEERLEQINAELRGFAYSVAHDLRTPLRGMQGFCEALSEDYAEKLDDTGRSYAVRIAAAAKRMDELIRDLLDYSRLSNGELPLAPVEFSQVVAAAKQQLAGQLAESGATLTVADGLPCVLGHFGMLVQVLANLIGNSIKFVPSGVKPMIAIRAEQHGTAQRILVQDNGIGIPAQFHHKIFRVFERLHGQDQYPGTGIGLAVVRKGVERLGGKVGLISDPGQGACFWIELTTAPAPTR